MKTKFLVFLLSLCLSLNAVGQTQVYGDEASSKVVSTVSKLPANSKVGSIAYVTDATNASDCTVGGGSTKHSCVYDGSVWTSDGSSSGSAFSGGLGSSYQDATEIADPANPSAGNDRFFVSNATHLLKCLTSGGASCMPTAGAASWSSLTTPTGNQPLSMSTFTSTFTWGNTLATNPMTFTFGAVTGSPSVSQLTVQDTTGSTNTGALFQASTVGTSTALPFKATAQGTANGIQMSALGVLAAIGSGHINADQCNGAACGVITSISVTAPVASTGTASPTLSLVSHGGTARAQLSDNTGTSGNISKFAANGDITDGGIAASNVASLAGSTFTGKLTTAASVVGTAGFNIPAGVAPTSPVIGDHWLNGANLFFRDNSGTPTTRTLFNSTDTLPGAQVSGNITGNAAGFTGSLVGDVSGTQGATSVDKVKGVTYPSAPAAHTVAVVTSAATTATAKVLPDCQDTTGNHLNYTQSSDAFSCGTSGTGGGMTNPMTTLGDIITGGAAGSATRLAGPTTPNSVPQVLVSIPSGGAAVAPAWVLQGVGVNPQTGTTYTVAVTDRASYLSFSNAGAIAVTLPDPATSGFGSNFPFVACDIGAGTATITRQTSATISYSKGASYTSAATNLPLTTGQCAWFYSDNTNWSAIVRTQDATSLNGTNFAGTTGDVVDFGASNIPVDSGILASNLVRKDAANTGAAAMTLDLSGLTGANAFKVPVGAGLTAGANGTVVYDSTAGSFHFRINAADAIGLGMASAPVGTRCLHTSGTTGLVTETGSDCGAGGAPALSAITAATSSPTALANGNFPQTWNWAQTTDAQSTFTFGETSAATAGTLTNALANQSVLKLSTAAASTATPLSVVQGSISGTVAFPTAQFQTTWNNSGLTGIGLLLNVTDTSSAVASLLADFRKGNTSQFKIDKSGNVTALGTISTAASGAGAYQMTAGTAQGHATASTITDEAPAAVTAYENIEPGTSATGFRYGVNASAVRTESFGELSGDATTNGTLAVTVGKVNGIGIQRVTMVADWTCGTAGTSTSCTTATIVGTNGTPLTITLPSITASYHWQCDGVVGQATAATANNWNFLTATNAPTNMEATYSMGTSATASANGATTGSSSTTTANIGGTWTLGGTATKMPFHIQGSIEGASASGTVVSLQLVAPTAADVVTVYRGATCSVTPF